MSTQVDPAKVKALLAKQAEETPPFNPTADHIRAKSTFWSYFGQDPTLPMPARDLASAVKFGNDRRIRIWWDVPGFQDWFYNRDEFRQKLDYLSAQALLELEGILTSNITSKSDKLTAIKLIMQLDKKLTANSQDEGALPERINKMTKAQLEEYIRSGMRLLPTVNTTVSEVLTSTNDPDNID